MDPDAELPHTIAPKEGAETPPCRVDRGGHSPRGKGLDLVEEEHRRRRPRSGRRRARSAGRTRRRSAWIRTEKSVASREDEEEVAVGDEALVEAAGDEGAAADSMLPLERRTCLIKAFETPLKP